MAILQVSNVVLKEEAGPAIQPPRRVHKVPDDGYGRRIKRVTRRRRNAAFGVHFPERWSGRGSRKVTHDRRSRFRDTSSLIVNAERSREHKNKDPREM